MNVTMLRATAFFGVLVVLAGYMFVYRTMEAAVAQRDDDIRTARATLAQRLAIERQAAQLNAERARLERDLQRLHLRDDRAAIVERFLRATARISAGDHVAIESVLPALERRPQLPLASASPASTATPAAQLEELPLDLSVRGAYADVIRATRDLSVADATSHLTLTSLAGADARAQTRPQLIAVLHVVLLKEPDDFSTPAPRT